MDDRQSHVVAGAGLQESRLNTEFIEWLNKWGPRILMFVAVVALAYVGYLKLGEYRQAQIDEAFANYETERATGSPDLLLQIAAQYDGKASVWSLATLDAADILLRSARTGVAPGGNIFQPALDDTYTDEQRTETFERAASLYNSVIDRNKSDADRTRLAQNARWGLASALVSLDQSDEARATMTEYVSQAEKARFTTQAEAGRKRLETLELLATPIPVYRESELPLAARTNVPNMGATDSGSLILNPGEAEATDGSVVLRKVDPSELKTRSGDDPIPPTPAPEAPDSPESDPG